MSIEFDLGIFLLFLWLLLVPLIIWRIYENVVYNNLDEKYKSLNCNITCDSRFYSATKPVSLLWKKLIMVLMVGITLILIIPCAIKKSFSLTVFADLWVWIGILTIFIVLAGLIIAFGLFGLYNYVKNHFSIDCIKKDLRKELKEYPEDIHIPRNSINSLADIISETNMNYYKNSAKIWIVGILSDFVFCYIIKAGYLLWLWNNLLPVIGIIILIVIGTAVLAMPIVLLVRYGIKNGKPGYIFGGLFIFLIYAIIVFTICVGINGNIFIL